MLSSVLMSYPKFRTFGAIIKDGRFVVVVVFRTNQHSIYDYDNSPNLVAGEADFDLA